MSTTGAASAEVHAASPGAVVSATGLPGRSGRAAGAQGVPIPSLDGIRALAIAAVVLYHYGVLRGGFLGVDLFFVLSGYLITRQILGHQHAGGRFTLAWFWSRRVRRLLPAVLVLLAVTLVWTSKAGSPSLWALTTGQARAALVYGTNWFNIFTEVGYFDVKIPEAPLNHLWSLAVEEQFYIAWPLLALLFIRRWKRPGVFAVVSLVLALCSMAAMPLVFSVFGQNAAYEGTGTRVGAILLGAAIALFAHRRNAGRPIPGPRRQAIFTFASLAGLGGFAAGVWMLAEDAPSLAFGGLAAVTVTEAALVTGVALHPRGLLDRILGLAPVAALGRRAYSLYLWHVPVYALLSPQYTSWDGPQLLWARILVTALATELSYRLIENPIRRSSLAGRRLVALALLPAIAVFGLTFLPAPRPPAAVAAVPFGVKLPPETASLRIMVAGDSWGLRTWYGLTVMPPPRPAQVFNEAQPSCGIADPLQEIGYNGKFAPTPECLSWRTRWEKTLETQRPDAVILNIGNWDQAPQQFTPDGPFLKPCDADYQTRYATKLDSALNTLTRYGTQVFMTNVRDNDGPNRDISDCMNSMLSSASARFSSKGVHLLDLRRILCGETRQCPNQVNGKRVYDDTGHLFITTQVDINAWELQAILAQVKPALTSQAQQSAVPLVPTDALALDGSLAHAFSRAKPAFPAGTSGTSESDRHADDALPPVLQGSADTIKASAPSARLRIDSGKALVGRAYAYQFSSDAPAGQIAAAIQRYAETKNSRITALTDNQKLFTLPAAEGTETIAFLRRPNTIIIIDLTAAIPDQQTAARKYLEGLG